MRVYTLSSMYNSSELGSLSLTNVLQVLSKFSPPISRTEEKFSPSSLPLPQLLPRQNISQFMSPEIPRSTFLNRIDFADRWILRLLIRELLGRVPSNSQNRQKVSNH